MPLGDIAGVGYVLQGELLGKMGVNIIQRPVDKKAAGTLLLIRFLLRLGRRMQRGMHSVKLLCHGPEGLVDFIHLGGLEEKAAYPEADGLLGIGKVTVAGEHGDQHIRELAA